MSERTALGGIVVYAAAFALMIVAGVVFVVATRGFLNSIRLLWVSAAFSIAAILAAGAGLVLSRRR